MNLISLLEKKFCEVTPIHSGNAKYQSLLHLDPLTVCDQVISELPLLAVMIRTCERHLPCIDRLECLAYLRMIDCPVHIVMWELVLENILLLYNYLSTIGIRTYLLLLLLRLRILYLLRSQLQRRPHPLFLLLRFVL